jgi:uncharacterized protein with PQ loop repeat
METLKDVVAWAVALSGLGGVAIVIPQLLRLIKVKNSEPFSLVSIWGTSCIQILMLAHALLQRDWHLTFMMTIYSAAQVTFVYLIQLSRVARRTPWKIVNAVHARCVARHTPYHKLGNEPERGVFSAYPGKVAQSIQRDQSSARGFGASG